MELFSVKWHHRNTQLVKVCAREQIISTGSNRKIAIDESKTSHKIRKDKVSDAPLIKTIKYSQELRLISPQTQKCCLLLKQEHRRQG